MRPLYFDHAATTPVDQRVVETMCHYLSTAGEFGNPSSLHAYGQVARSAIEEARALVAHYLHADPSEMIWTSGATEAINLALKGAMRLYQRRGKHLITLQTEHKAVLDTCQFLEKEGYQVTYLKPLANGLIDLRALAAAMREETVLVSVMQVNNETGVIQDLASIAKLTSTRGVLLHVDAAQSPGKAQLDVTQIPIDFISLCAHKVYGPKGVGALYVRKKPRRRVEPLLHGGGHEQGMRSGTLATHQIVGMGQAFHYAELDYAKNHAHVRACRDRFLAEIHNVPTLRLNTDLDKTVPHILSLRFEGMLAEAVLADLPLIATSSGSACQGKGTEGSYVLRAMGFSEAQAKSTIRWSFGSITTLVEVDQAALMIRELFAANLP